MTVTPEEARAVIPDLSRIYSEPFADSSQIPTFLVSRLARRHVTVSLSGDGGDEVFCGYRRYDFADRVLPRLSRVPRVLRSGAAAVIRSIPPRRWDALAGGRRMTGDRLHKAARVMTLSTPEEAWRALVSHWESPCAFIPGAGEPSLRKVAGEGSAVRTMMLLDTLCYLPDDILVKVDRASMAVGLESRIPLLDHRLIEFAWRLPVDMLRREGQSKWPLRQILYRRVPRELIERPKAGFAVPLADWLRGPLREWAESLLSGARLRGAGLLDPIPIRAAWDGLLTGHEPAQERIWNVLMLEAWREGEAARGRRSPAAAGTRGAP
jgi:asparagine synthase (glutamine-hydrolysing)